MTQEIPQIQQNQTPRSLIIRFILRNLLFFAIPTAILGLMIYRVFESGSAAGFGIALAFVIPVLYILPIIHLVISSFSLNKKLLIIYSTQPKRNIAILLIGRFLMRGLHCIFLTLLFLILSVIGFIFTDNDAIGQYQSFFGDAIDYPFHNFTNTTYIIVIIAAIWVFIDVYKLEKKWKQTL